MLGAPGNPVVDEPLRGAGLTCAFAHTDQLGVGMGQFQKVLVHKAVVEHQLGMAEGPCTFDRDQIRVAGTGTDQP